MQHCLDRGLKSDVFVDASGKAALSATYARLVTAGVQVVCTGVGQCALDGAALAQLFASPNFGALPSLPSTVDVATARKLIADKILNSILM